MFIAAALVMAAQGSFAQKQTDTYAAQHRSGIFVMIGTKVNNRTTAAIERMTPGTAWKQTAAVTGPVSFDAFRNNLTTYGMHFPDYPLPTPEEQKKIWEKAERYGIVDSLSLWAGSPTVLLALGAALLDTTVVPGTYTYRVTVKDESGKTVSTALSRETKFPQAAQFGAIRFLRYRAGKDFIYSEWLAKKPVPNQVRVFRADVNVGRFERIDAVKGFTKKNDSAFIFIKDTVISPAVRYAYFLEPINLFENSGASSDTAQMTNWDINALVLQEFTAANVDSGNTIRLRYKLSDPGLVSVVKIFRSVDADKGYALIAEVPPNQQAYDDNDGVPMRKYYYRLKFTDLYGNESGFSVRGFATYASQDQPFAPELFSAEGTKRGVLLSWRNYEANTDGFYIYRNDGISPALEIVSPMLRLKPDSVYTYLDSSKALRGNRFYSYALRTESTSHVKSGYSDTLMARPLLPTAPPAPVDVALSVDGDGMRLRWSDVSHPDDEVAGYLVYRKDRSPRSEYKKITSSVLAVNHNYFVDTTCAPDVVYEYAVTSCDVFGGESGKAGLLTAVRKSGALPPPGALKLYPQGKNILLRWDPVESGVAGYAVYRYVRGTVPVRIGTVKQQPDVEFTDTKVEKGKLYFYFIRTTNAQGKESEPGPESSVRFGW